MKFSFCQLLLLLLVIFNFLKCHQCVKPDNSHDSDSDDDEHQKKVFRKLYDATNRTLTSLLAPSCYEILFDTNGIQSQYISSGGLIGRVIPVGTFTTQVLALEYLYGILCPIPNLPPRRFNILSYDLVRVTYDKKRLITQSEFIVYLTGDKQLTFFVTMAFDKQYKLCGYDGQIRNLGLTIDALTVAEQQSNMTLVCGAAAYFCTGDLQQYASPEECMAFLSSIPYGSFDRGDQGNVVCRAIHTNFVPLIPSIHCPHIGPTGGGACYDKTMDFYYEQPDFMACAHKYN